MSTKNKKTNLRRKKDAVDEYLNSSLFQRSIRQKINCSLWRKRESCETVTPRRDEGLTKEEDRLLSTEKVSSQKRLGIAAT